MSSKSTEDNLLVTNGEEEAPSGAKGNGLR